jgi:hypothetical protein
MAVKLHNDRHIWRVKRRFRCKKWSKSQKKALTSTKVISQKDLYRYFDRYFRCGYSHSAGAAYGLPGHEIFYVAAPDTFVEEQTLSL